MNKEPADKRIAYGARCTWWGSIYEIGTVQGAGGRSLPCCPRCRGPLFEVPSALEWFRQVKAHDREYCQNYEKFIAWVRGRCYRWLDDAVRDWRAETGLALYDRKAH